MFQPLPAHIFAGHRNERGAPQIKKERVQATASEPQKKRKGFSLEFVPKKKQPVPLPVVQEMRIGQPTPSAPPAIVAKKLGKGELVMAIDIETAGWEYVRKSKIRIGMFGHATFNTAEKLKEGRIVQLGWAIGYNNSAPAAVEKREERMIYPAGFTISPGATGIHKIDQKRAEREGQPLEGVLVEFMMEVQGVMERGGRLVAHNLDFDAEILYNELARCSLESLQRQWSKAARMGCCTMDPEIGRYLCTCFGEDAGPETAENTMSLQKLTEWLLPESVPLLDKHHTASADAELALRLYIRICQLAQSCQVAGGAAASDS